MATTRTRCDVAVVGAGLAGLTAAELLRRGGLDVVVLEAAHRVGGRVRTVRQPFVDGQYVESGAEWVDTVHERIVALMNRFGLEAEGPGERWSTIRRWLHIEGRMMGPDDRRDRFASLETELDRYDALTEAEIAGVAHPARPQLHPDAARLDSRSLADVMDEADLGPAARLVASRDSQGEFAAEPSEVSQLFVLQQRAVYAQLGAEYGDVRSHRIRGGSDGLVLGLADSVGSSLRLGSAVVRVDHGPAGVVAHTTDAVYEADHIVLACSLVPLRQIVFDPPLPDELAAAIVGLGYGTVTKTGLQYAERRWQPGYATTESAIQRVYEPTAHQPGTAGVLMAYTGGANGRRLGRMTESERIAEVAAGQFAMHGDLGPVIGSFSRAWSAEPRYGGSYSCYRPGEVTAFWNVLRQPVGRLHLAGEHVATWCGYMEGAVESGETVASRILAG